MIKNTEIRVGNFLEWNKNQFKVCAIFRNVTENEVWAKDNSELHPIQLTEELLVKCGFKKTGESGYCGSNEEHKDIYSCGLVDIAFSDNNFYLWVSIDDDPYYSFCWTKIQYVHQLQNLVFAISGTELEINL